MQHTSKATGLNQPPHPSRRHAIQVLACIISATLALPVPAASALSQSSTPSTPDAWPAMGSSNDPADTAASFATMSESLEHDPTVSVLDSGRIRFEDPVAPDPRPGAPKGSESLVTTRAITTATDPLLLHSRPGAPRIIHLDFNGHLTSGTWFNTDEQRAVIASGPYTIDSDPEFSIKERNAIAAVWAEVAQDFAPFDVDVTTEEPALNDLVRTEAPNDRFGIRVVITPKKFSSQPHTGVAYLNSFGLANLTPAFVFSEGVAADDIAYIVSHEVGHSLGLNHDGVKAGLDGTSSTAYYTGEGSWGPIMGSPWGKPVQQWSKGEYRDADNQQDDLAVIAATIPVIIDDFTDVPADAALAPARSFKGLIASIADRDWFRVKFTGGALQINASAVSGGSADVALELWSSNSGAPGILIAKNNRVGLSAFILRMGLAPGEYLIAVAGTGEGDVLKDGYSAYGSIGHYQVTLAGGVVVAPALRVSIQAPAVLPANTGAAFILNSSAPLDNAKITWKLSNGVVAYGTLADFTMPNAALTGAVTVESQYGTVFSASKTVRLGKAPIVSATASARRVTLGSVVEFAATALDPDGQPLKFQWYIDGGYTHGATSSITASTPGEMQAEAIVTDADGLTTTQTVIVDVVVPVPVLKVAPITLKGGTPADVTFSVKATTAVGPASVKWQFSDKTTLSGSKVTKRFFTQGNKFAIVTVTDQWGCASSATVTFSVKSASTKATITPRAAELPAMCYRAG